MAIWSSPLGSLPIYTRKTDSPAPLSPETSSPKDDETVTKLLNGGITIPVSTYFTVNTKPLPERIVAKILNDEEICENLHFLGKRSVTNTSEGIRIVTLAGALDPGIVGGVS